MNKYNGRQLFLLCLASAGFTLLVAFLFGLLNLGPARDAGDRVAASGAALGGQDAGSAETVQASPGQNKALQGLQGSENDGYTPDERNNIAIYQTYSEAVVNISSEVVYYSFFEAIPQEGASGSGSIIDPEGYILTNNHVVKGASRLFVTLASGDKLEAKIIGVDAENDLAVIKINPEGRTLKTISLGTSATLKVGQKVLAIGNPFSFNWTLTTGVVSGLGRPIRSENNLIIQNMIQTDAAINSGNSGGPMLDSQGRLIGINSMIYSPSGGSVGIGFAVPVDTARRVVPELIKYGKVSRGWIDITPIQVFPELVKYAKLPVDYGILVSNLAPGGNAEKAGLRGGTRSNAVSYGRTIIYLGGDIITEIDGTRVTRGIASLYEALEDNKPGDKVKVKFYRGTSAMETQVVLGQRPDVSSDQ